MGTTRKKLKIVGKQEYINADTGVLDTFDVVSIEERDANFHKLWLSHLLFMLDIVSNKKTRFIFWLLDQMNGENTIVMTQRQMSGKSGICLKTISSTMKILIQNNFLIKINIGAYKVNPDIIFKGGKTDRFKILIEYTNTKVENDKNIIDEIDENEPEKNSDTSVRFDAAQKKF
jgi:hypothetical protein